MKSMAGLKLEQATLICLGLSS